MPKNVSKNVFYASFGNFAPLAVSTFMLKTDLECFAECLNVSAKGLVKSLLGEVCAVGGGEDGEDALLQTLLRSLRTVSWDALVCSWG